MPPFTCTPGLHKKSLNRAVFLIKWQFSTIYLKFVAKLYCYQITISMPANGKRLDEVTKCGTLLIFLLFFKRKLSKSQFYGSLVIMYFLEYSVSFLLLFTLPFYMPNLQRMILGNVSL